MGPWRTVFEHRVIGPPITNCRHSPGTFQLSTPQPPVIREIGPTGDPYYFGQFDGVHSYLRFDLADPVVDIIGVEARATIRLHNQAYEVGHFSFLSSDADWGLLLRDGSLEAMFNAESTKWDGFAPPTGKWMVVAWSWRWTGQSILRLNDTIVATRADVHPGQPYAMTHLWLGSSEWQAPPVPTTFFPGDIRYARISVLTREAAESALDGFLPPPPDEFSEECLELMQERTEALLRAFRELMQQLVSSSTKNWQYGDRGRPVSSHATEMHHCARLAAMAIGGTLAGNEGADEAFEKHFRRFLELLIEQSDDEEIRKVTELVSRLRAEAEGADCGPCEEVARQWQESEPIAFGQLERLLELLLDAIDDVFEGGKRG